TEDEVLEQVFLGHSAVPKLADPGDIAALALFLASDAAAVINGSAHSVDGGWSAA
ncbi:MAG: SDR family oxidoreductase, partial [Brevibacterium aurantiacum]